MLNESEIVCRLAGTFFLSYMLHPDGSPSERLPWGEEKANAASMPNQNAGFEGYPTVTSNASTLSTEAIASTAALCSSVTFWQSPA